MKSFKTLFSEDKDVTALQNNVKDFAQQVTNVKILNNVLLENVKLSSALPNKVQHSLGRIPTGFWVYRQSGPAFIWDDQSSNDIQDKILILNCSADCVASIIVF